MTAGERFAVELGGLAAEGQLTPCADAPEAWCSDDRVVRERAAVACRDLCPLVEWCWEAAEESGEGWHVWGGVDRTVPRSAGRAVVS